MLYSGDFFTDHDRRLMERVHAAHRKNWAGNWPFKDPRLPEMLFRYRARNYPESLSEEAMRRSGNNNGWPAIISPAEEGQLSLAEFQAELAEARQQA